MGKTYPEIDERLREQTFVEKTDSPLWRYCCVRFLEFWKQHDGPRRRVPNNYSDKDRMAVGWYFPAKWVSDFKATQRRPRLVASHPSTEEP